MAEKRSQSPWLEVNQSGQVTVVTFSKDLILTGEKTDEVAKDLVRLVDQAGQCKLILDLGNVRSLTSSFLGKLIMLDRKVQPLGGRLALCNLSPDLHEVFEITQLPKILNIYASADEALGSF